MRHHWTCFGPPYFKNLLHFEKHYPTFMPYLEISWSSWDTFVKFSGFCHRQPPGEEKGAGCGLWFCGVCWKRAENRVSILQTCTTRVKNHHVNLTVPPSSLKITQLELSMNRQHLLPFILSIVLTFLLFPLLFLILRIIFYYVWFFNIMY